MLPPRTILVAEDEPALLARWVKTLSAAGWTVTTARNGHEARRCLADADYSMVICDLHLGGPSAIDLLQADPQRWRRTPFLVVTGFATVETCRDALKAGAIDFIQKPKSGDLGVFIVECIQRAGQDWSTPVHGLPIPESGADANHRLHAALRLLDEAALKHDASVGAIAAAVGICTDHLTRLFRQRLGCTPMDLIHTLRIQKAERLLLNPTLGVKEIADLCGYGSEDQFVHWFKKKHGVTPSEFRRSAPPVPLERSAI